MDPNYLNLQLNDDIKGLAVEFGVMNHYAKDLLQYIKMSDENAGVADIENNLVQIYLHCLRAQKILDGVEDSLGDFQMNIVHRTGIREKRPDLFE